MNPKKILKKTYSKLADHIGARKADRAFIKGLNKTLKFHSDKWETQFGKLEGQMILTEEQKKQVSDLWGPRYPAPAKITYQFHEFYTKATGRFNPHYIPDDLYMNLIDAWFSNRPQAKVLDNKCLYAKLFPQVKQPVNIAYRMNGSWLDEGYRAIGIDMLTELLNSERDVIVKYATNSMGGGGVFFYTGENLAEKILDRINSNNRDIVIQKKLIQHPELAKLNPESINTIRHISFFENGKATVYSSILRMGINHSRVDNASSGGITCGITESGRLKPVAYAVSGKKYEKHPSSGIAFDAITVPSFEESIKVVESLHQSIPLFRLISWDIAIDQTGTPVLLEPNLYVGELDFHQLNNGPLFGEDQDRILSEVKWKIPEIYYPRYNY